MHRVEIEPRPLVEVLSHVLAKARKSGAAAGEKHRIDVAGADTGFRYVEQAAFVDCRSTLAPPGA